MKKPDLNLKGLSFLIADANSHFQNPACNDAPAA